MDKKQCPDCGSPVASQSAGSITQWISSCSCYLKTSEKKQLLSVTVSICARCKKRIYKNDGSLTQWIFGEGRCKCDRPDVSQLAINTFVDSIPEDKEREGATEAEEEELENVSANFPKERYKPLAELGKGSSGIVYLCRDKLLNKKVAVKTLSQLSDEQLVSFQNEARTTSKLKHPYLLTILDFGATEGGEPFMVLDYFAGISLQQYLKDYGTLDAVLAKQVFKKLAHVLEYAHQNDTYHRDIKPSNILLSVIGDEVNIKLIDFGIAKVKENTGHITVYQDKTLAGTPAYMAPDTASGLTYDNRSEVYSLGCVLFESLTGQPVFRGHTALDILNQHVTSEAPLLNSVAGFQGDEQWSEFLARCLAKDKEKRFNTMAEVASAVEEIDTDLAFGDLEQDVSSARILSRRKLLIGIIPVALLVTVVTSYTMLTSSPNNSEDKVPNPSAKAGKSKELEEVFDVDDKVLLSKYESKAKRGSINSQLQVARAYEEGKFGAKIDHKKAFFWYNKAAKRGNKKATFNLARLYRYGLGVEKNERRAFVLVKKLAEQGYLDAQIKMSDLYKDGIGTGANWNASLRWAKKAAESDSGLALYTLGNCYFKGVGTEKDRTKALTLFLKSARKGFVRSYRKLGYCYAKGYGIKQDLKTSFSWYFKAANDGDVESQGQVGKCYKDGIGVEKNRDKAMFWLKKASDAGNGNATRLMGYFYNRNSMSDASKRKALEIFKKAAEQGDSPAMNDLGNAYRYGRGVKIDYDKAMYWYLKAADKGYAYGKSNIADMYFEGVGVKKDYKKAFKWYQDAASHNWHPGAEYMLGVCYLRGNGVKKDDKEALKWYRKAADRGSNRAIRRIGDFYYFGWGVKKNHREAFKWYKKTADKGYSTGIYDIAYLYEHGEGVKKDLKKALKLYQQAVEKNQPNASTRIGNAYLHGELGLEKNGDKAFEHFKLGAENGDLLGECNVGLCYEYAHGVKKDVKKAVAIYQKLAEKNLPQAQNNLANCYRYGIVVPKDLKKAVELFKKAAAEGVPEAKKALREMKR